MIRIDLYFYFVFEDFLVKVRFKLMVFKTKITVRYYEVDSILRGGTVMYCRLDFFV